MPPTLQMRYLGCLRGAALGDARGARETPRTSAGRIRAARAPPGQASATTQLMLFTADGLMRAHNRALALDAHVDPVPVVHRAYLRWLDTQRQAAPPPRADGWLAAQAGLYRRRDPPSVTMQALRSGLVGRTDRPINNALDGSVLSRGIPVALASWSPFAMGRDLAAITHSHPAAATAAGAFAHLLQQVVLGRALGQAAEATYAEIEGHPAAEEALKALDDALDAGDLGDPDPERVRAFGDGSTPQSALAIGVYCASATDAFDEGLAAASSVGSWAGAVAGALLGAAGGLGGVPEEPELELEVEVRQLATDLWHHFGAGPFEPAEEDWNRYPG